MTRAVREFRLWRPGDPVVVGVSGGADSTALLAVLAGLPSRWRPIPLAAHLDHGWRGARAAAADRAAVQRLCLRLRVPLEYGALTCAPGTGRGGSPEALAREARYRFLREVARGRGASVIAVGHHRGDRAETVLLRLARGAGARGLAGIRPVRPLGGPGDALLVRPLWFAAPGDIRDYLTARALPHVEDATNLDLSRPRNRIRRLVLPRLTTALGPELEQGLLRAADNLAEDDAALTQWAARVFASRRDPIGLRWADGGAPLPVAVRHRVLSLWWQEETGLPGLSRSLSLALQALAPGAGADLPGGRRAVRVAGRLQLIACAAPPAAPRPLPVPGATAAGQGGVVRARWAAWPDPALWDRVRVDCALAAGDAAAVRLPLGVRAPRAGELVVPLGEAQPRAVRELLRAARVPLGERRLPRLVVDADDDVLWIAGVRQTSAFSLRPETSRALILDWGLVSS